MLNLTSVCTIQSKRVTAQEVDTGNPVYGDWPVMVNQACEVSVLSADQHSQSWGDGQETTTSAVSASLIVPNWAPPLDDASKATVTLGAFPGLSWRIASTRPGEKWTTYLLLQS